MAENVGAICGATTGTVYAIVNPDDDSELDNPRWLLIQIEEAKREPLTLVRIDMASFMACTHPDQVQAIARSKLGMTA